MPLYEYQCTACHRRTEKIQKFSDLELTTCPHCGGTLERTLTAPNVQFKGAGWYKDLYSSPKPAAAGSGEGSSGSTGNGSDAPATGKNDTAPSPAPASTPAASPTPASSTSSK